MVVQISDMKMTNIEMENDNISSQSVYGTNSFKPLFAYIQIITIDSIQTI